MKKRTAAVNTSIRYSEWKLSQYRLLPMTFCKKSNTTNTNYYAKVNIGSGNTLHVYMGPCFLFLFVT